MAALKAADVDRFLRRPDLAIRALLVYGPDQGLVSERAGQLAAAHGAKPDDPFSLQRLDGDVVASDPARLADELFAVSMFGNNRVVRLRVGTRAVAGPIAAVLAGPAPSAALIVEAGDLKADSPLRRAFESATAGLAIPCFVDGDANLARVIDEEFRGAGLAATEDARALLIANLGGDRLATRQELRKVALYCHGAGRVTEADVAAIVGDIADVAIDAVVDAMGLGDSEAVVNTYRRLEADGTAPSSLLSAALRHVLQLHRVRAELDQGRSVSESMRGLSPPVFFKRQGVFERQLVFWSVARCERALAMIADAILETRRARALDSIVAERALLAVAAIARRRA